MHVGVEVREAADRVRARDREARLRDEEAAKARAMAKWLATPKRFRGTVVNFAAHLGKERCCIRIVEPPQGGSKVFFMTVTHCATLLEWTLRVAYKELAEWLKSPPSTDADVNHLMVLRLPEVCRFDSEDKLRARRDREFQTTGKKRVWKRPPPYKARPQTSTGSVETLVVGPRQSQVDPDRLAELPGKQTLAMTVVPPPRLPTVRAALARPPPNPGLGFALRGRERRAARRDFFKRRPSRREVKRGGHRVAGGVSRVGGVRLVMYELIRVVDGLSRDEAHSKTHSDSYELVCYWGEEWSFSLTMVLHALDCSRFARGDPDQIAAMFCYTPGNVRAAKAAAVAAAEAATYLRDKDAYDAATAVFECQFLEAVRAKRAAPERPKKGRPPAIDRETVELEAHRCITRRYSTAWDKTTRQLLYNAKLVLDYETDAPPAPATPPPSPPPEPRDGFATPPTGARSPIMSPEQTKPDDADDARDGSIYSEPNHLSDARRAVAARARECAAAPRPPPNSPAAVFRKAPRPRPPKRRRPGGRPPVVVAEALDRKWVRRDRFDAWLRREIDAPPRDRAGFDARDRRPLLAPDQERVFLDDAFDVLDEPFREEPKGKPGHFDARLVRRYLNELRTNPQANDPNPPQKLRVRLPTRLYRAVKALRSVVRGHPDNFYTLVTVEQPRDRLLFLIEILDGSCEQIPLKWSSEQQSHLANSLEAVTAEELKVQMDVMLASIAVKDGDADDDGAFVGPRFVAEFTDVDAGVPDMDEVIDDSVFEDIDLLMADKFAKKTPSYATRTPKKKERKKPAPPPMSPPREGT